MRITKDHLQFYREHKLATPAWSMGAPEPVSIHTLINAQVPQPKQHRTEPNNLIHLVKLVQRHRQETVKEFLRHCAFLPCGTDPKRRTGYARSWYAKIVRTTA
jgi:hypothetical protein